MSVPFTHPFDLGALSGRDAEVLLVPTAAERVAIAAWLDASALEGLQATVRLSRHGEDLYDYAASFTADVVQACVVTLEPVRSHLTGSFSRQYRLAPKRRRDTEPPKKSKVLLDPEEDDSPEELSKSLLDLAQPVLEELSLALDPYPRAPGVSFDLPGKEKAGPESPFAVLAALKPKPPAPKDKPKPKRKKAAKTPRPEPK